MISRLMLELETGGNVRLEDGTPRDLWFKSCADLLHSRFHRARFSHRVSHSTSNSNRTQAAVESLRVTRVTRIHNRLLRNNFEMRLHELLHKVTHAKRLLKTKSGVKYASKNTVTPVEELAAMEIDFSAME